MGNKVEGEHERFPQESEENKRRINSNSVEERISENRNINKNAIYKNLFGAEEKSKISEGTVINNNNPSPFQNNVQGIQKQQNNSNVANQKSSANHYSNMFNQKSSANHNVQKYHAQQPIINNDAYQMIVHTLTSAQELYNHGCELIKQFSLSEALVKFEEAQKKVWNVYPSISDQVLKGKVESFIQNLYNAIEHVNAQLKEKYELKPISNLRATTYNRNEIKEIFNKVNSNEKKYVVREIQKNPANNLNDNHHVNEENHMSRQKSSNFEADQNKKISNKIVMNQETKNTEKSKLNIPEELLTKIYNEIIDTKPNIKFDDVIGLESAKQTLKEIIILPNLRPDLFVGLRSPPRGLLLFGPPGTGKTMIAKAVATECKCTFFSISASSLTSKYLGESEKLVKALFHIAFEKQPSVIFIDEIDSILSKRSDGENDAIKRLKTEFLVQFDGVGSDLTAKVLVVGATNRPFELDNAVLRRLPKKIYVGPFDVNERVKFLEQTMKTTPNDLNNKDYKLISQQCENYSNSDLKELCKEAAYEPIRDFKDINNIKNISKLRNVTVNDFKKALKIVRGTLSKEILKELEKWNNSYGAIE